MTRQEIERMAKLEERNAELARENAELRKKVELHKGKVDALKIDVENQKSKSLRWVANQIPDFEPKTAEDKMLLTIKRYSTAGADEINQLESENTELKARLEKAEKALGLACCEMALLDICCQGCDNEETCRTMFLEGSYKLKTNECEKYWLIKAEQRLAELKRGKNE